MGNTPIPIPIPNSTEDQLPAEDHTGPSGSMFTLVVHLIIFLIGMPGNCLILRVYWTKKTRKTSTHVLIMALAWADLYVCLLRWPDIWEEAFLLDGKPIPQVLYVIKAVTTTAISTSVLITAVIAVDRYDCVCRSHRRFFTERRAKLAVSVALLFSFSFIIQAFVPNAAMQIFWALQVLCFVTALVVLVLCYGLVYRTIRKHVRVGVLSNTRPDWAGLGRGGECSTIVTPSRASNISVTNMTAFAMATSINVQPNMGSNTVAENRDDASTKYPGDPGSSLKENPPNISIHQSKLVMLRNGSSAEKELCAVSTDRNSRPLQPDKGRHIQLDKAGSLQRKTTRMLCVTSVVFLLTWLPYWTLVTLEFALYGGANINPSFVDIVRQVKVVLFINNAVNPLIYGVANRRFRKDCREVLSKIKPC